MNYSNYGMILNNSEINPKLKEQLECLQEILAIQIGQHSRGIVLFALSSIRGTVYAVQGSMPNDLLYPVETPQKISRLDWKLTRKTAYLFDAMRLSVLGKQSVRSILL
jgi:hypothetical protein